MKAVVAANAADPSGIGSAAGLAATSVSADGLAGTAAAQVATALTSLMQSASGQAAPSAIDGAGASQPASAAPAATTVVAGSLASRDIVIQLEPEHLGSVSIRMRMAGDKLDIQIQVANGDTLDILNRDRHLLTAAVGVAGGDNATLLLGAATPSSQGGAAGQPGTDGQSRPQPQPQQDAAASFTSGERGSSGDDRSPASASRNSLTVETDDPAAPNPVARTTDDGLYV